MGNPENWQYVEYNFQIVIFGWVFTIYSQNNLFLIRMHSLFNDRSQYAYFYLFGSR